jgi:membrane protein YqaA with SNARE-associated domain
MFTAKTIESTEHSSDSSRRRKKRRELVGRVLIFLIVIGISVGIVWGRNRIENLAAYGYPALFLASVLVNATIFTPAPSFAVALAAGTAFNPIVVGLVAGLGGSIGEMTGYLAGISGRGVIEDRPIFRQIQRWMEKSGTLVIFLLGAVPNPFFDVGGMIAGAVRMPVWRFILAGWLGKSIRLGLVALIGTLLV